MKLLLIAALAVLVVSQLAAAACHNATGSCTNEHFVCANEEMVPHAKRCDGVEDCADGTDEYLCDQSTVPLFERTVAERQAIIEVSCVKCTCYKGTITVLQANAAWFKVGTTAPRGFTMMTDAPNYQNKACNIAQVTSIVLDVYKKQNKGCRGWVCCFRQEKCLSCSGTGTSATHCY